MPEQPAIGLAAHLTGSASSEFGTFILKVRSLSNKPHEILNPDDVR